MNSHIKQEENLSQRCLSVLKNSKFLLIVGALFSFFGASVLMSGIPEGFVPNISFPYLYAGDSFLGTFLMERLNEGWFFDNIRSGWPFGSNFLDYPVPDLGSLLVLKILVSFLHSPFISYNLYFLLGFPLVYIFSFLVSRKFGINSSNSFVLALLYTFAPFHFLRLGHLFYTWYFVAPIGIYVGYAIYLKSSVNYAVKPLIKYFLISIPLAFFGVYYALFNVIVIGVGGVMGSLRTRKMYNFFLACFIMAMITLCVMFTVLPNIIYKHEHGVNLEVAQRLPLESEVYGFKLIQLVLPRENHRFAKLSILNDQYSNSAPLINENRISSLGLVGTLGIITTFFLVLCCLVGSKLSFRLRYLSATIMILFLFGTIGGFGSIFAYFITPSIRGWNRISIYITCGSLLTFFIVFQMLIQKIALTSKTHYLGNMLLALILIIGITDQTVNPQKTAIEQSKNAFLQDNTFIKKIEKSLPAGSAVYQLPYMPFPEVPPLYNLADYMQGNGFSHSKSLKWSYGGMKGREGDLFYRTLSKEPLNIQLAIIKKLGFAGIYVDRRGYKDNGNDIVARLSTLLGKAPEIRRADDNIVFFKLSNPIKTDFTGMSAYEIMQSVGYIADKFGKRYNSLLCDGIDFTKNGLPSFIKTVNGLSQAESWGCWSDANVSSAVALSFRNDLPDKFTLAVHANAFGPNIGKNLVIKIGSKTYNYLIPSGTFDMSIPVNLVGEKVETIELIPPVPTSPKMLGQSTDERRLGIGLISLKIIEEGKNR